MSTQTKALRLADLLETGNIDELGDFQAAAELRRLHEENERLKAQSQQGPVAWMCCVPGQDAVLLFDEPSDEQYPPGYKQPLGRLSQPAQQKPETVYQCLGAGGYWIDQTKDSYDYNVRHGHATVRVLYTSPPAQRTWVGLTDKELEAIWYQVETGAALLLRFAEAIEAKLKEKNT